MKKCFKCSSYNIIKNGKVFGWQRYKCTDCGYQFTKNGLRGKPIHLKMITHSLYASGMSMREIAKVVGVTPQSISRWIKKWHITYENEYGNNELRFAVGRSNLLDCIDISDEQKSILITNNLPSGAKVNIVIQIPVDNINKVT